MLTLNCEECGKPFESNFKHCYCNDCIRGKIPQGITIATGWNKRRLTESRHYAKDLIQPLNRDGTANQDYEKIYGKIGFKTVEEIA